MRHLHRRGGGAATAALEPQAVFLDLELPCLAGYALAFALRHLPRPPRVVALTAGTTPTTRKGIRAAGFRHWLTKPADPEQLREALAYLGRPAPGPAEPPSRRQPEEPPHDPQE